jgi:hypothetical protein
MYATIMALSNPLNPTNIPNVRLFAIIGTWMEADIIASTVKNAFTQECERVYLVDNNSLDETVSIACENGAILARTFETEKYDESIRLHHMNAVMREVCLSEPDRHIWWLFLDADEFPHGPWGMTLLEYLRTIDKRFRVVGSRFFDHYPSGSPAFVPGRHPLDFQPLCGEISVPMCARGHRKHSLLRFDKEGEVIEAGRGFHLVRCADAVCEPEQPVFLHHFPFREELTTRARLGLLWNKDANGHSRADISSDSTSHMLARMRSLNAVYCQDWASVANFVPLDPMYASLETKPPPSGVVLRRWDDLIGPEHHQPLRWYSMVGAWNYDTLPEFNYGDDTSYIKGIAYLDGYGVIEDWGCGFSHAKRFVKKSTYVGVDGSSSTADRRVDLQSYTSDVDCIFMRHVLEHNANWRSILRNAIASFGKRMVLVIFTPFGKETKQIAASHSLTTFPVPDISFKKEDLTGYFSGVCVKEEMIQSDTQYGVEHIFYLEKSLNTGRSFSGLKVL